MQDELVMDLQEWSFPDLTLSSSTNDEEEGGLASSEEDNEPMVDEFIMDHEFRPEFHLGGIDSDSSDDVVYSSGRASRSFHQQVLLAKESVEPAQNDPELMAKLADLEQRQAEYDYKLQFLNQLLNKLRSPLSLMDQELIELLQDIVKRLSKQIICKEISTDPNVFCNMIEKLKSLIEAKNSLVNIYLSADDFNLLNSAQNQSLGLMQIDNNLQQGDIIIKSNFAEVRALLNERIDQLMRIQND